MRLLHIQGDPRTNDILDISLCEFLGEDIPPYMILSHRWREEEVLLADMAHPSIARAKKGYAKLETSCRIALREGLEYAWDDTCCIDKTSSSELSEAINSMFNYYAQSVLCIAYLDDVEDIPEDDRFLDRAVWFTRGWTLQELIAPKELHYYSQGWAHLGTKATLSRQTSAVTGISESILHDSMSIKGTCVSEKMSWAAKRTTTRAEDEAYSLMGLFGVNMPPLYGEGRTNAFRRLQLEILRTTSDHTLFTWDAKNSDGGMLAPSVSQFTRGSDYEPTEYLASKARDCKTSVIININDEGTPYEQSDQVFKPDFNMTNSGLHIQLCMETLPSSLWGELWLALLRCRTKKDQKITGIILQKVPNTQFLNFNRVVFDGRTTFRFTKAPWKSHFLPITKYNPIWISEYKFQDGQTQSINAIPSSIKTIHFEVGVKSGSSVSPVWHNTGSDIPEASSSFEVEPPHLSSANLPEQFASSRKPLLNVIRGSIVTESFAHKLISFRGKRRFDLAFGAIHNSIWFLIASGNSIEKGLASIAGFQLLHRSFSWEIGKAMIRASRC